MDEEIADWYERKEAAGSFRSRCGLQNSTETVYDTATFLKDNALPYQFIVTP